MQLSVLVNYCTVLVILELRLSELTLRKPNPLIDRLYKRRNILANPKATSQTITLKRDLTTSDDT